MRSLANQLLSILIVVSLFSINLYPQQSEKIFSAFITDVDEIIVTLNSETDFRSISLLENGSKIQFEVIETDQSHQLLLNFQKELDFTHEYLLKIGDEEKQVKPHWKAIDRYFTYTGELGSFYSWNKTDFKLWAPLASKVVLNLYEKGLDEMPSQKIDLNKKDKGVWVTSVPGNLKGKFYTYSVTNFDETKEVLDPYAKSLAVSTKETFFTPRGAIVDPSGVGPDLDFAEIQNYEKREDAIIWEIHVRDFTVDPDITTKAQFGTFSAFSERLDYIKDLGVTHIQLLPVLSYTYSDEQLNDQRDMEYDLGGNYNWGYGPDNYFSVDGMYSENPEDPELRIKELKELVRSIHEEGMGVTLDVVYNHTAALHFLEDIVPGYYHFMDSKGVAKESYGGGRPGSTHAMARKLIVDSIVYWTKEFKVDGFRYDLMGDLDAETIQIAYDEAKKINPNLIKVGECWRTFAGDDGENVTPADQDWMDRTNSVACFSDEMRNELKSGFGSEGEKRFITGGARNIQTIFNNVIAKPGNMNEDDPGDVLQYIAAHDNLTLHDVISYTIKKDPAKHQEEIHKRIRLGNAIILTSQGISFIHAGQEYGRTKQWLDSTSPERESVKAEGFEHPYFVENSYDASDAVNMFDWDKVTNEGIQKETMEFTKGLISLRRSSDAFRLATEQLVAKNVSQIQSEDIKEEDLVLFFKTTSTNGEVYHVLVNTDSNQRSISGDFDLTNGTVLVDSDEAGTESVKNISGVSMKAGSITIDPLTVIVIKSN
jgi:secreted pullulanase